MKIGRNDPCPCGSGKKYKKCCWASDEAARVQEAASRTEALEAEQGAQAADAKRAAGSQAGGGSVSKPKGPPPKAPGQLRRRAV